MLGSLSPLLRGAVSPSPPTSATVVLSTSGASPFHTSALAARKLSAKQKKHIEKSAAYRTSQKNNAVRMELAKQGKLTPAGEERQQMMQHLPKVLENSVQPYVAPRPATFGARSGYYAKRAAAVTLDKLKTYVLHSTRFLWHTWQEKIVNVGRSARKAEAAKLYVRMNEDRASGAVDSLHNYMSGMMVGRVRKELLASNKQRNEKFDYQWEASRLVLKEKGLRYINQSDIGAFVQATFAISSTQSIKMVEKKTGEIAGQTPAVEVEEYFVFEKKVQDNEAPWLILAEIELEEEPEV
eukprot:TRINITY_DN10797_c0_g1_i1.p1 TRINITY_DN10797_c0_g1~~TRINITY_DN10797_c0_g1_i1.p1  ORF type:complete len:296 (+),score=52.92 TRINITY_DN10797_c0_g1_i1:41-928(+)